MTFAAQVGLSLYEITLLSIHHVHGISNTNLIDGDRNLAGNNLKNLTRSGGVLLQSR